MSLNQRLVTDMVFATGNPAPLLSPLVNKIASPSAIPSILLGPIPAGATIIVEHGIHENILGPAIPTIVFPDRASPLIVTAADKFTVTIHNPADAQEVTLRAERKHTIEEDPLLLVQSLWQGAGAGGAVVPDVQDFTGSGCVLPGTEVVRFNTDDNEPLIYLAALASGADGRTVLLRSTSGTMDATILPDNLAEGVNGPPGATYTMTPAEPAATFMADIPNNTWWKV